MRRPLENARPIGPIASLTPTEGELTDSELQMLMRGLTAKLRSNLDKLEQAENERRPEPTPDDIVTEMQFDRNRMDSAVSKIASMYKGDKFARPDTFGTYQTLANKRDKQIQKYE